MALPITPAQQEMLRDSIRKFVRERKDAELISMLSVLAKAEVKFRDAIAIPCHNAEPHDT